MDFKDIEAFIALAKKEGVSSLKYESKDVKISVTLGGAPFTGPAQGLFVSPTALGGNEHLSDIAKPAKKGKEDSNFHKITSPFVGTFYSSSSPGENVYVKVGDKVRKGQTLCIVEAMKIMNEIDSDVNGEIVEVCVENESLVEYGQVLFLIKVS